MPVLNDAGWIFLYKGFYCMINMINRKFNSGDSQQFPLNKNDRDSPHSILNIPM